jgi:hypothetical protein
MSKYVSVEKGVYSVFGSTDWVAEKIPTYPSNFIAKVNEYIRVSIIPSSSGANRASVSGILIIDIFTPANGGSHRAFEVADKLDKYLAQKTRKADEGTVQFQTSTLNKGELDKANPLLFRTSYTIPFNYFEST